ncbi:tRNA dihydrouridine synthase [Coemansia thaxteri]|uniref:tRNA-dihydrouridine(16/17) synthase [NAD(P)(+)] n=1 Tax=Coemansia thaxteri TaxID=2663907 RepID=A0A9W8BBR6_9FUNG|nr:tRNA dihydrouridine synthase [Coemansia thaxteri]KAJ2004976.1 tRNA dihydrouridine synthase [Coemansia thaxteri]KAJ2469488.1 tRNA dihydrouridine synthase [Coemansia sp. RSA 2322]KAJ2482166.1 tRNA dihydrouridine synthase [Coemansia sp. RSA 2320]
MTVATDPVSGTSAKRPAHFTLADDEIAAKFPNRLRGFDLYRKMGSPKHIVAPMVDQSELAWRMLSRNYGADLCYTPMFHAKMFGDENPKYRDEQWQTNETDKPVIVQFCANDPDALLAAAKLVVGQADAVDLNLGCPQHIARRGHYGSYLMEDWELVSRLIRKLHENLDIPVTAKIRVFPELDKTVAYAKMVEAAGAQIITVHGRLREQKGHKTGLADWAKIKAVKDAVSVPVFANGNILYFEDIQRCIDATNVDGVMSAETNLYNPALFSGKVVPTWQMAEEYLEICNNVSTKSAFIRAHLFKLFRYSLPVHVDLRQRLAEARDMDEYWQFARDIKCRLKADADAESTPFDPDAVLTDEFGYRKYPHWICQPALRFEHDKEHSKSKRLLNEAQVDATETGNTSPTDQQHDLKEGNEDTGNSGAKRQKTVVDNCIA